jgi:hypothetical protein
MLHASDELLEFEQSLAYPLLVGSARAAGRSRGKRR